ncbi:MAG: DUF2085 domain-containing protein [Anaerolineae bacterium]
MSQRQQPPADNSLAVRLNRWALGWSKRWLTIILLLIGLYAGLPVLAPILMKLGATSIASGIYTIYSGTCHQLAYRSWFLFGEQSAYPRLAAQLPNFVPYEAFVEEITKSVPPPAGYTGDTQLSRQAQLFVGDEQMGYKVAICQRDVAIYWALFAGGLIFSIPTVRRHLRPVPWWLYVILGLVPIGIDGFSQLLSQPLPGLLNQPLFPLRETSPILRTVTGALFGLMNAWLAFPYLEESSREVKTEIQAKFDKRDERERRKRQQEEN